MYYLFYVKQGIKMTKYYDMKPPPEEGYNEQVHTCVDTTYCENCGEFNHTHQANDGEMCSVCGYPTLK